MTQPSRKTAAAIILAGVAVTFLGHLINYILDTVILPISTTQILSIASVILAYDVGIGIIGWGVGWYLASISPLRKTYLYAVALGLASWPLDLTLAVVEARYGIPLTSVRNFTVPFAFQAGPMMLASGAVAAIIVERHRIKHGLPEIPVTYEKYIILFVAAVLLLPLFLLAGPVFLAAIVSALVLMPLVWRALAARFAFAVMLGLTREARRRKLARTQVRIVSSPKHPKLTLRAIAAKSYYPAAFGLGVSLTLISVMALGKAIFGVDLPLLSSENPVTLVGDVTLYSLIAMSVGAIYVGPVVWIFENAGIRLYDVFKKTLTKPSINSLADEMIEIYTFIQAPIGFVVEVIGRDIFLIVSMLLLLLYVTFTVSFAATLIYTLAFERKEIDDFMNHLFRERAITWPNG